MLLVDVEASDGALDLNHSSNGHPRCLATLGYSIFCTFNISLNKRGQQAYEKVIVKGGINNGR